MSVDTYIFAERAGGQARPILFTFHGTGGDEQQFHRFGGDLLPEATVISPRGDVSEYGALRFFKRRAEGQYDMADLAWATDKMAAFIREQTEAHGATAVIGLGYSNGANILANVLIEYPGLVDAAVLMHPLIPFTPKDGALFGTDVLITAGQHDPICPAGLTERLAEHLIGQGATVRVDWHEGGHELRQSEVTAVQAFLARFA